MAKNAHNRRKEPHLYFLFRAIARLKKGEWATREELAIKAGLDPVSIGKRPWYFVTFEPWVNIMKGENGEHLYSKKPGMSALEMEREYPENRLTRRESETILSLRRRGILKPVV